MWGGCGGCVPGIGGPGGPMWYGGGLSNCLGGEPKWVGLEGGS